MLDEVYYYDFSREQPIDWEVLSRDENKFSVKAEIQHDAGKKLLLAEERIRDFTLKLPRIREFILNGERLDFGKRASSAYIGKGFIRRGMEIELKQGLNTLEAEGEYPNDELLALIKTTLAEPLSPVRESEPVHTVIPCPDYPEYAPEGNEPDLTGYTPGIGCRETPGRFGFAKGSGFLDYGMPVLGSFDKMYLCGHPEYHKPFRWSYSTLPKGAPRHGSWRPADHGIEGDTIRINHLSCFWCADLDGIEFSCTGSLASPGVITERSDGRMRIGDLEFAGNYQYMMIPRKDGTLEISTLKDVRALTMGKNFLLLFGCTEFPDLPLLLVFQKQPRNMRLEFRPDSGRLSAIEFENCPLLISATPFGFESFKPIRPDDADFLRKAAERCLFWSRALLAFPVRCEEYFRNDLERKQASIIQKFRYRVIRDEWNTVPLELAPLPPVLSISGLYDTQKEMDFHFPTKHGHLTGRIGNTSSYVLPWMPTARKFPLCSEGRGSEWKALLKKGFRSYFDFVTSFPESTQSYPYAGAVLEPFAWTATLFNFLDDADREKLSELLQQRLRIVCDPESRYKYPVIDWGYMMKTMPDDQDVLAYYRRPEMNHLVLWNWYERVEPFTKTSYRICYLNVNNFTWKRISEGSREEVRSLNQPMIENDWGLGLTFYYVYLACLISGDFSTVRKSWSLLNDAFSYFSKMHDWACMGTGYSENGILWVEGANYGAFTSYINLAEAIGDRTSWEYGQYLAAKQQALRHGIFRGAQHYFCKLYGVEPWHILKIMEDEASPYPQHMGVPDIMDDLRLRPGGVYNLTTEGLYPELFAGLKEFQKEDYGILLKKLKESIRRKPDCAKTDWTRIQEAASLLICMALDPDFSSEELRDEIDFLRRHGRLFTKWRGIHIFSRRLPENYFEAQLLAWDDMKHHPIWLEYWQNVKILSAEWRDHAAELVFEAKTGAKIRFGCRMRPVQLLLNGAETAGKFDAGILELEPETSGNLRIIFDGKPEK